MTEAHTPEEGTCPKCGSEEYDTIKWSWQQGITPYDDYCVCCSCQHEWSEDDVRAKPSTNTVTGDSNEQDKT